MSAPSAIIFDLGKVLVDFDYSRAGRRIAASSSASAEQVREFIDHSPLLERYETGRISTSEFFEAVRTATGYGGTVEEFAAAFGDIFSPLEEMIEFHALLRRRGFPTYILSNTNELAIRHIRTNFPFFAEFDGYIFSHEIGVMKPHAEIYEAVEHLTGKRGAELLFIDDRLDNVTAAATRGWHAVHHEAAAQTRFYLERLLAL